ncbi:MAG: TIGR04438 family Trp-rich protein [Burkholderiales bacterium]|nr:MAG: TIGR04438 family Trp-rich protein [Burkholderiales bacterium]
MYFLMAGIALTLLKYFEIGFVAGWSWWWVLSPYAMAVAWWAWADSTGYTKRKAMEAMNKKKQERIDRQRESLGMGNRNRRR